MKLILVFVSVAGLLLSFPPLHAQSESCLEPFRSFSPIELEITPTTRNQTYNPVAVWFTDSRCFVVGSSTGLWVYDIDQPRNPLMLAQIDERAIEVVAVNPIDSTIGFSVGQEPVVYLIYPDTTLSTLSVSGQAVTAIAFSPDGSLVAVASSDIIDIGLYYEPRVQIWNSFNHFQTRLGLSGYDAVAGMFFTSDNQNLLIDGWRWGYIGNKVEYWHHANASRLWSYDDLLRNLNPWSENDPLVVSRATIYDYTVALSGLDGWHDYDDYYGSGIHIWDAATQERKLEIVVFRRGVGKESEVIDIAFNSDGSELVSAQTDGTISFWNAASGAQIGSFQTNLDISDVSFSPDDRFLAVVTPTEILIWDIVHHQAYTTLQI